MKAKLALAALTAAVLILGGYGIAAASIPDSGGVIHGCYKPTSDGHQAALNVIDTAGSNGSCPAGSTELDWNHTGPAGPQGATGPAGPAGPSTAGSSGLDSTTVIGQAGFSGETSQAVACPSDHPYAVGGGISQQSGLGQPIVQDRPVGHGSDSTVNPASWFPASVAEGWLGEIASNPSNAIWTVYAICAK